MDAEKVLEMAIAVEEESAAFYRAAVDQVDAKPLKDFFLGLSQEDLKQIHFLKKYRGREQSLVVAPSEKDYRLSEEIVGEEDLHFAPNMAFRDCVALAMKREEKAMQTYRELADTAEDLEAKKLFLDLVHMKQRHKAGLEQVYNTIAFNEVW